MALTYIRNVSVDGLVSEMTLMIWTDLPDCGLDLYKECECGRTSICDDTDDLDRLTCGLDLYKEGECGQSGLCDDTDDLDRLT